MTRPRASMRARSRVRRDSMSDILWGWKGGTSTLASIASPSQHRPMYLSMLGWHVFLIVRVDGLPRLLDDEKCALSSFLVIRLTGGVAVMTMRIARNI